MKPRPPFRLPEGQAGRDRRAVRLEYWTIFFLATIVVAMYFSLGGSQAMRTAWLEDLLGFVPPLAFLAAHHVRQKPPSKRFPFGFQKVSTRVDGTGRFMPRLSHRRRTRAPARRARRCAT